MSEDKSMSLINLGELSKPVNTFIEKVSSAIGGISHPWQIKRVAKAEAEVDMIRATSEIQITDLHRRAMHRFVEEEAVRQNNMETIAEKAIPHIQEQADPGKMDNDWIANFFDKSRIISDSEMQDLWAKVLAGEANQPGAFSKRTINFLSDLDKIDAEQFQKLCRFGWYIEEFTPVIFDSENEIYRNHGITFDVLTHLDSIGLIRFESLSGYVRAELPQSFSVSYCGKPLELTLKGQKEKNLPFGQVLLTSIGKELLKVADIELIPEFYEYAKDQWKEYLPQENDDEKKTHNNEGSVGALPA
jgi:hypothetical protein